MRNRTLTGARAISAATCMILVLSSYMPSAFAESPPQDNSIGDLVAVPVKPEPPEPPVNPCNTRLCDNVHVDLTTCLDPDGCETPIKPIDPSDNDFELCLNLNHKICPVDPPDKAIDDLITPPGPEDPGDDGPGDDEPGDEGEQPEDPGPEDPEPETPEPTDTPEPTEPETPKTPTPGGETPTPVDIDTPRPGNPNFTG